MADQPSAKLIKPLVFDVKNHFDFMPKSDSTSDNLPPSSILKWFFLITTWWSQKRDAYLG
jgi:hypothetical protein